MNDKLYRRHYVGTLLNQLPDCLASRVRQNGHRPTIKALFTTTHQPTKRQLVATYETGSIKPSCGQFNLPGGGVKPEEGWTQALERELQEELGIVPVNEACLRQALITDIRHVPTSRSTYQSKLLVIASVRLRPERFTPGWLQPSVGELQNLHVEAVAEAMQRLDTAKARPHASAAYYQALKHVGQRMPDE